MRAWLERVQGWLLLAGIALGALVSVFYRGRAAGRRAERQERNDEISKQAAQAREEVRNVENEIAGQGDDAVADRLKSGWVRDPGSRGG